jgi:hypothetical protein
MNQGCGRASRFGREVLILGFEVFRVDNARKVRRCKTICGLSINVGPAESELDSASWAMQQKTLSSTSLSFAPCQGLSKRHKPSEIDPEKKRAHQLSGF